MNSFEELLEKGKHDELLKLANQHLNTLEGKFNKIRALRIIGEVDDAMELLNEYRMDFEKEDSKWLFKFLYEEGMLQLSKGKLDEAQASADRLAKNQQHMDSIDLSNYLSLVGVIHSRKGELDAAMDYHQRSLKLREEIGNPLDTAQILNHIGIIYFKKGELDTAMDYYQRSLKIIEEIGNPIKISMVLNNIGLIYWNKGKLDAAMDYHQRSLKLREEIGNPPEIATSLNNIGIIYSQKGELDTSLDYHRRSLKLKEEIGNTLEIAVSLNNIGEIYSKKDESDTAMDYYQRSLKIREEIGNPLWIAYVLQRIATLFLDEQKADQAESYLTRLEKLSKENDNKKIELFYQYTRARYLKTSVRNRDKVEAEKILAKISKENDFDFDILIPSLVHLIELLIIEYQTYREDEVLQEIQAHIDRLFEVAQDQHLFITQVNVLILKAKLAVVNKNFDESIKLYDLAISTAENKRLTKYIEYAKSEKDDFMNDIVEMQKSIKLSNVSQIIQEVQLIKYVKKAHKVLLKPWDGEEFINEIENQPENYSSGAALTDLYQKVVDRTLELQITNQELSDFTMSVTHDLRAPLRAMQGFSSALKEDYGDKIDASGIEMIKRISQAADKMDSMIRDLLIHSKINQQDIKITKINLEDCLNQIIKEYSNVIDQNKIEVIFDLPSRYVHGNRLIIEKILNNLLGNAVKFTAQNRSPLVKVWTETRGSMVRLNIEDNGIGIEEQYFDKIFEVFERLHREDEFPGTGIGLAIVKKGVERLYGYCGVESKIGEFSRFWIELPI